MSPPDRKSFDHGHQRNQSVKQQRCDLFVRDKIKAGPMKVAKPTYEETWRGDQSKSRRKQRGWTYQEDVMSEVSTLESMIPGRDSYHTSSALEIKLGYRICIDEW
jgi:hypothetical protein